MFGWMRRKLDRPVEMGSSEIEFLGAQTGSDEARLQQAVSKALAAHAAVRSAYLARVRYGATAPENIALCLTGASSDAVLDEVQKLFWAMFDHGAHLDLLFITADEEARLVSVCAPFYVAST